MEFSSGFLKIQTHLWSEKKHGKFQQKWLKFLESSKWIKEQECMEMVGKTERANVGGVNMHCPRGFDEANS